MNTDLINQLLSEPHDQQWLEFKGGYYDPRVLGKYLSALANSACSAGRAQGHLLFDVDDTTRKAAGTTFRPGTEDFLRNQIWRTSDS